MAAKTELGRSPRRDKLFIIAEIMDIAKDTSLKTQIMYQANLGFVQLNDYLNFLLKIGLLTRNVNNGQEIFKSTEKGIDFLQRYREITGLLGYTPYRPIHKSDLLGIRLELKKLKDAITDLEIYLFNTVTCPRCDEEIFPRYKFCPYCGAKLRIEAATEVTN